MNPSGTAEADRAAADLTGPPRTKIRRARGRAAKDRLKQILGGPLTPVMRLRAELALGGTLQEPPEADVISRALTAADCASFTAQMATRRTEVDATHPLEAAATLVRSEPETNAGQTATALTRSITRITKGRATLSARSAPALAEAATAVLQSIAASKRAARPSVRKTATELFRAAIASQPAAAEPWPVLELLEAAERAVAGSPGLSEAELEDAEELWAGRAAESLRAMARAGKAQDFRRHAMALRRARRSAPAAKSALRELKTSLAELDPAIQSVIADLEGEETSIAAPTPADSATETLSTAAGAGGIEYSQLASALLRCWKAAPDSERAREAFTELEAVLGGFFGMRLAGNVGETVGFNPRSQELLDDNVEPRPEAVTIRRPRVEWVAQDGVTRVLIKALVARRR